MEIYPLTFRQGDSVDLDNPHLHCQENIFMSPNLLLSPKSNPHMELQSGVWYEEKKEHKCIWQVIILERSQLESFKTVLMQHKNHHWDTYDLSPQTTFLWLLQSMRRKAIWDFCHEGQPTKSQRNLNRGFLLVFVWEMRRYLEESRVFQKVFTSLC